MIYEEDLKYEDDLKYSKCKVETCPYCTKTCPMWTYFGSNYPKNGLGLAVTLVQNLDLPNI